MVAKLICLRSGNFALTEESALVEAASPAGREAPGAEVVRLPHYPRHARTAELEPPVATFLPIRPAERRRWSAELAGPGAAGLVLHGVGGIGKSALAAQIAERVGRLEPDCVTTILSGEVTADAFLAGLAAALRRYPKAAARVGSTAAVAAVAAAGRTELPWAQRFALLRRYVLDQVPVLLVLDNFDDNLSLEAGTCTIRDPSLIELLTSWAGSPHRGRVLITCRHRFAVPETAASRLGFRHLGPLSRSGAIELAMSLAALGLLGEEELDRAWRLLGGHPRAMEYLDALLLTGDARFPALAERLAGAIEQHANHPIEQHADHPAAGSGLAAPTELPLPTAETAAVAVADLLLGDLFDQLSAEAQGLLIRASVYRAPFARDVLLLPVGRYSPAELAGLLDECRATGLLAADPADDPPSVFVHRWTAVELHRRLAERQRGGEVIEAHRRAAEYWRWRITGWPHDYRAEREAGYHLLQVSDPTRQAPAGGRHRSRPRRRLRPFLLAVIAMAVAALLTAVAAFLAAEASGALSGGDQVSRPQAGPRTGPDAPLRTGELAAPRAAPASAASLRNMLAFVRAKRPPYLPARAGIVRDAHGLPALSVEFAAPSPVGLLQAQATPLVRSPRPARSAPRRRRSRCCPRGI